MSALKLKQLAELFKLRADVIIDPNFIEYHKGLTLRNEAKDLETTLAMEAPCQS